MVARRLTLAVYYLNRCSGVGVVAISRTYPVAALYNNCGSIRRPNTVRYKVNRLVYYPFVVCYNIFGQQLRYN